MIRIFVSFSARVLLTSGIGYLSAVCNLLQVPIVQKVFERWIALSTRDKSLSSG